MRRGLCLAAIGLLTTATATAQGVTLAAAAKTPINLWTWTYWAGQANDSRPAGPLPATGFVGQSALFAPAFIQWNSVSASRTERFTLRTHMTGQGSLSQSRHESFEIVLNVASPTSRAIELDLERTATGWSTMLSPTVAIDLGNDGTVEYPDLPVAVTTLNGITAGPVPLQIAISVTGVSYQNGAFGGVTTDLNFSVRPDNDLIIQKEVDSCLPGVPGFEPPIPVFVDDGVDLRFAPGLLIASAVAAPTWWTPTSPVPFATACLLVPQPDILLWLPEGFAHIALPAAVRPGVLHLQVVHVDATGFVASDGYQVTAN